MTYETLENELKKIGFKLEQTAYDYYIKNKKNVIIACIDDNYRYLYTLYAEEFTKLQPKIQKRLFELIIQIVKTPIKNRVEQKYLLKHKFLFESLTYLNYNSRLNKLILADKHQTNYCQTKFTKDEIEKLKKKFNTKFEDFELLKSN
ncbi:hypothetical protein [Sneathia sanguinegens]|uniref:hypothetical protein n=1 Tax=Sneathia sanguinegens TaxID=40543 RepID=UPI00288B09D2|nr:hypothetical protein [Sneathia sanguinegens]